ncbi:hypothetical protein CIL05_14340 [Virgibacillus profundi]|uniref:Sporulation protein n=1 Tax=Virgibacillus profundi TaxID=2024555 RepID=A0A2A2ICJ9_9BACI|nr:YhcN/YlaJ family sporulation lipoprotein [Virgibacillus profundi]PAV28803.1 hypothetical protein CIL05_14340 [Virgibacillus profundi]PXY52971.1 hypothetical protein CIT14_14465 [Virgibacillus profundi]
MNYYKIVSFCLILLLFGCGTNSTLESSDEENRDIELTKISASNPTAQHPSNQAKEELKKYDEITTIKAVNTDKDLLIAVEVHHHDRFKLANIRKELTKELEKMFPEMKVELTTDKKIILELDQLENKIQAESFTKKKLEKEIKKLIKLSKEQT